MIIVYFLKLISKNNISSYYIEKMVQEAEKLKVEDNGKF